MSKQNSFHAFTEPVDISTVHDQALSTVDTLIVFDWDDTLMPSAFLSQHRLTLNSRPEHVIEKVGSLLTEHTKSVVKLLELALKFGPVTILTNAETGWVQLSAHLFMPDILPTLDKLTILSARSTYEPKVPNDPMRWKYNAFKSRISAILPYNDVHSRNTHMRQVLSFGDSHVEREAVRSVCRGHQHLRCKSVKFAERPSVIQLMRQVDLVTECFRYIYESKIDLDLQLNVTVKHQHGEIMHDNSHTTHNHPPSDGTESKAMYDTKKHHHTHQPHSIIDNTEKAEHNVGHKDAIETPGSRHTHPITIPHRHSKTTFV